MTSTALTTIKSTPAETSGTKADGGKPRIDLIAPEALMAMGEVLRFGAAKYSERNWEKGMAWGRVYAAVQRHLIAWSAGEDDDPESGLPHLWHALTGLHFLVAYDVRGSGTDDRSPFTRSEDDEVVDDMGCEGSSGVYSLEVVGSKEAPLAPGVNPRHVAGDYDDDLEEYNHRRFKPGTEPVGPKASAAFHDWFLNYTRGDR